MDRPLCESLASLSVRIFRGEEVDINAIPDPLLNRCLWTESIDMLECFAAAHPQAKVLHVLSQIHQTYHAGGPHALWLFAHKHGDMDGLLSYLVRVHDFHVYNTLLDPRHAAFFELDDFAPVAWVATAEHCGRVLADKYLDFKKRVIAKGGGAQPGVYYYATKASQKSAHGLALDELHIMSGCCRTYMLTQPQS